MTEVKAAGIPPHENHDSNLKPLGQASKTDPTTIQHDEILRKILHLSHKKETGK